MQNGKPHYPSREAFEAALEVILSSTEPPLRIARRLSLLSVDWLSDVEAGLTQDVQPAVDCLHKALALDPDVEDGGRWLQDHANLIFAELLRTPATPATYDAMQHEVLILEPAVNLDQIKLSTSIWNILCAGIRRLAAVNRIPFRRLYPATDKALASALEAGDPGDLGRAYLNAGNARFNNPEEDPHSSAREAYPFFTKGIVHAVRSGNLYLEAQLRYSAGSALIHRFDYATERDFTRASMHLARASDIFEALGANSDWGDALVALVGLYVSPRARHIDISDETYQQLLEHLELAVSKNPPEIRAESRAIALMGLASLLRKMAARIQAQDENLTLSLLKREFDAASEAIALVGGTTNTHLWASAEYSLAEALVNSSEPDSLGSAQSHLLVAIALLGDEQPFERFHFLRTMGEAHMQFEKWQDAHAALTLAVESSHALRGLKSPMVGLYREGDISGCFALKAYCELKLGRTSAALSTIEQSRELRGEQQPAIDLQKIATNLGDKCLLVPILTPIGAAVVAVQSDQRQVRYDVVYLPEFARINAALHPQYYPSHAGWIESLSVWREEHTQSTLQFRMESLDRLLRELWGQFLAPIFRAIPSLPRHLVLIAHGGLGILPVHAALFSAYSTDRPDATNHTLHFARSLGAFEDERHDASLESASLLSVGLSRYRDVRLRRIALAEEEARHAIRQHKSAASRLLTGTDATKNRLLIEADQYDILHLACHGTYSRDPDESALQLWPTGKARMSRLTARKIQQSVDLARTRLVILSACDSGVVEHRFAPNELAGLLGAFLRAGADQVICSLWAVNDVASILVWDHFYECLREGDLPHIALSHAQRHLREITVGRIQEFASSDDSLPASRARILSTIESLPEEHQPFKHALYWAPFVIFTG